MIKTSLDVAVKTGSNTRIVNACKWGIQIHLESAKLKMNLPGNFVARHLNILPQEYDNENRASKEAILDLAGNLHAIALSFATSDQQVFP